MSYRVIIDLFPIVFSIKISGKKKRSAQKKYMSIFLPVKSALVTHYTNFKNSENISDKVISRGVKNFSVDRPT